MKKTTSRSFGSWQWQVILVSMLGYAMYYFVRKNFSTAMPSLESVFGITKTQLGLFLTINGIIYGVSRFVNGFIADRCSHRKFMATGLAISGLINLGYAFSDKCAALISGAATGPDFLKAITVVMSVLLIFNGYVQGMGVPPTSGLLSKWIHPKELASKMSVWNMSHSIGAGLIFVLGAVILNFAGVSAWRLFFLIPSIIALLGAVMIWTAIPDSPSEVGLEEIHKDNAEGKAEKSDPAYHKAFLRERVFKNPVIWVLALVNFFVYIVRFSMLDWGMMILPGSKGVSVVTAGVMVAVFEFIGGNLGMLFFGWLTDNVFKGKAHHTCIVCMLGAAVTVALLFILPTTAPLWLMYVVFSSIAFFIYGPQALLGICAINNGTKEVAGTANGLLGIFGYASTTVSGLVFGMIADNYGWNATYYMIIGAALIGALLLVSIIKAPANGYEAAAAFKAKWDAEHAK